MRILWHNSASRRVIAGAMLAIYLACSLGVLPSPALLARWFGHAISEPYPCQDHGCGCASAHECWNNCCCYTPHQRLVWAIRHGVKPPASLRFTDEQWIAASNDLTPDSATCSLCVADIKADLEHGIARVPTQACENPADTGEDSCCVSDAPASPSLPFPSVSALACKGLTELLAFALPAAPTTTLASMLPPPPRLPRFDRPEDDSTPTRTLEVCPPPPRDAIALG